MIIKPKRIIDDDENYSIWFFFLLKVIIWLAILAKCQNIRKNEKKTNSLIAHSDRYIILVWWMCQIKFSKNKNNDQNWMKVFHFVFFFVARCLAVNRSLNLLAPPVFRFRKLSSFWTINHLINFLSILDFFEYKLKLKILFYESKRMQNDFLFLFFIYCRLHLIQTDCCCCYCYICRSKYFGINNLLLLLSQFIIFVCVCKYKLTIQINNCITDINKMTEKIMILFDWSIFLLVFVRQLKFYILKSR